ncbi:Fic family protein [Candidatus Palauibacter sp.]|uniref:Fic family protein n=1 Tax=Candidatus Palauibacter sp. TaxID=3101350 RepID=UPI003B527055
MSKSEDVSHRWEPIKDVPEDHAKLANIELPTLLDVWLEQKADLETRDAVKDFNEQLLRHWAIETGLIERLYVLDRGVTQLLVERGLHASLIAHDSANGDPDRVIALIRDQHRAVEGLFDFVASRRELGTSYIKQLHATITASQETTTAVNALGQQLTIPLRRGDYKQRPNNPTTADGSIHEYCPPEQVASEMDRLIAMHLDHEAKKVASEVQAAWLHHRFAQIHPFEDGNGRVARALATLVLLRAEWLPLVVTNDHRGVYLDALNAADRGNLAPLVDLFAKIEKEAFLQALSVARASSSNIGAWTM